MDADVLITSVRTDETRNDNTRRTVTDDGGGEYTTFRPAVGKAAEQAEGSRARISYHEEERNVYLDKVEPAPAAPSAAATGDSDPDEVAWRTAVDAAPYLLDENEAAGEVPPEKVFEKLEPFKDLVAGDIRSGPEKPPDDDA
jgi:hypothetical protein